MALQTPLIWDAVRGVSRQLDPADGLRSPGGLGVDGPLGFWGQEALLSAQPQASGDWATSLEALVDALVAYGLIGDDRAADWSSGLSQVADLGRVGGYATGRLAVGSINGWTVLEQPAAEAGVIQALVARSGGGEIQAGGGELKQLAYSPIASYGAAPAGGTPRVAAFWFDSAAERLKIWNGSIWQGVFPAALDALLQSLVSVPASRLMVSDGANGLAALALPATGRGGRVPMLDTAGGVSYVQLLSIGSAPPWSNGSSLYGPAPGGGGRSSGAEPALWFANAAGAESLNVWDELTQQWKGIPLANPLLTQLAGLRTQVADGDTLVVRGGQLERLPAGTDGESLTVLNGEPAWHARFSAGAAAPAVSVDGDYWQDSSDALWLRNGSNWQDLNQTPRFRSLNGFGGAAVPGLPLVHDGSGWQLAGPATPRDSIVAIAAAAASANAPISAAFGGIVTLTATQWSAVIDSAEAHPVGGGLLSGRTYYVSATVAGRITTQPEPGEELAVGLALSPTKLLLRSTPFVQGPAFVDVSGVSPQPVRDGLLRWDPASRELQVYAPPATPGGTSAWSPVAPDAQPGTVRSVTGVNGLSTGGTADDPELGIDRALVDMWYAPGGHVGAGSAAHALATPTAAGFLSAQDKARLDAATAQATANTLLLRDANGSAAVNVLTATVFNIDALPALP